jgi:hypothetical protein
MSNRLANLGWLRVIGLAAGAAVVSGAAVLVTASAAGYNVPFFNLSGRAPSTGTTAVDQKTGAPSALCTDFLTHFSTDLNTSQSALNAAFQKAIGETLADQVKSGKLTQAQGDKIKQRLAGRVPCAITGALRPPGGKLAAFRPALLSASASALGITEADLKADLKKGMSLSQIAAAQKPAVTEAAFRTRLIAKLTPVLDAAVTNKTLTKTQEQAIIKRLQTGPIPLWNRPAHPSTTAGT